MTDSSCATCIQPYLMFNGRCEEALEFYQKAVGAEIDFLMRFNESPEPCGDGQLPPGCEDKVMHASFRIGVSVIMASDGMCAGQANYDGFSLAYNVKSEAEVDKVFNALADGGVVKMPLAKTFWSPRFGMLTDRFGINWMVSVLPEACFD